MDVVGIGELLIDFLSEGDEIYPTLKANPGGAPCNFLATLAHFKKDVSFIGKVGNDYFGKILKDTLKEYGVDTKGLIISEDYFTTLAFVILDENKDRHFSFMRKFSADMMLKEEEVNKNLIDEAHMFYFGGVGLTKSPSKDTIKSLTKYAKDKGKTIIFDANLREALWDDLNEAKKELKEAIRISDIVKLSIEELEFLYESIDELKENTDAKIIFITKADKGAMTLFENELIEVEGVKADVKDTTGAGDIFFGTAINEILNHKILDKEIIKHVTKKAVETASKSCEYYGGISSIKYL